MSEQIERYCDGAYYSHQGIVYIGTFPEQWALCHLPDTGPYDCENCVYAGMINNVFIGYCANCAQHVYAGSRGRGFIDGGVELDVPNNNDDNTLYQSAFDTYLNNINLNNINMQDIINFEDPPEENANATFEYEDDGLDMTTMNICHYEGGYNDW